jgi:hypothetical protein
MRTKLLKDFAFVTVLIFGILIFYFIMGLGALLDYSPNYRQLLTPIILLLLTIFAVMFKRNLGKVKLAFPVICVFLMFIFYIFFGIINSTMTLKFWPSLQLDLIKAISYSIYGFIAIIFGWSIASLITRVISYNKRKRKADIQYIYIWDLRRLKIIIFCLVLFVVMSAIGFFVTGGFILLLKEDVNMLYGPKRPVQFNPLFSLLYFMGTLFLAILSGVYHSLNKKNIIIGGIFVVSLLLLVMNGVRTVILLPALITIFSYYYYTKNPKVGRIFVVILLLFFCFFISGWLRSGLLKDHSLTELLRFDMLFIGVMSEFTTFARVLYIFPCGEIFDAGTFFNSTLLTTLPIS